MFKIKLFRGTKEFKKLRAREGAIASLSLTATILQKGARREFKKEKMGQKKKTV